MKDKPVTAFGYGYDPKKLKNGVRLTNCFANPDIGKKVIVCEFEPHLSARNLNVLGELMEYDTSKWGYGRITKENTEIQFSGFFSTDKDAKDVIGLVLGKKVDNLLLLNAGREYED